MVVTLLDISTFCYLLLRSNGCKKTIEKFVIPVSLDLFELDLLPFEHSLMVDITMIEVRLGKVHLGCH